MISLESILNNINGDGLLWSIISFNGSGVIKNFTDIKNFENLAKSNEKGYLLTWSDLRNLSKSIYQMEDGVIVGVSDFRKINRELILNFDFSEIEIAIEADDSTNWNLFFSNEKLAKSFY